MISDFYKTNTRVLGLDDIPDLLKIYEHKKNISRIDKSELDVKNFEKRFVDAMSLDKVRIIGYFENNDLTSFLLQVYANQIPAWSMTMLGTKSKSSWNYKNNGLEYCWANAMANAEQQGIYRIYWALPQSWARTQIRTFKTTDVWYRYDIYVEEIVQPGNIPSWLEYHKCFGEGVKPHPVVIKQAILKNEHRKNNIGI